MSADCVFLVFEMLITLLFWFSMISEALRLIPDHEKQDCNEAYRLGVDFIMRESDPLKFLRLTDFNPW